MKPSTSALVLAAFLLGPSIASAHHGWNSYDDTPQKLTGKIESVKFANPHVMIEFAPSDQAKERKSIYLAPVSRMVDRGLPQDKVKAGMTVQIEAYPSKSKKDEMRAERITVDGKTVELR